MSPEISLEKCSVYDIINITEFEERVKQCNSYEYDEKLLANENKQAFLDAGHFYGTT